MNYQREFEIFQKVLLRVVFNVEYVVSLDINELARLYLRTHFIVDTFRFDGRMFFRQLHDNFQNYVKQQRINFINAYMPLPWNLICAHLTWTEIAVLVKVFNLDSEHFERHKSTVVNFERRLSLILMPFGGSFRHQMHKHAAELLQLDDTNELTSLPSLFEAIKTSIN